MDEIERFVPKFKEWEDEYGFGLEECCCDESPESYFRYLLEDFASIVPPTDPALLAEYEEVRSAIIRTDRNNEYNVNDVARKINRLSDKILDHGISSNRRGEEGSEDVPAVC